LNVDEGAANASKLRHKAKVQDRQNLGAIGGDQQRPAQRRKGRLNFPIIFSQLFTFNMIL